MNDDFRLDPRFVAGVALIGRTGATSFRVGWNDEGTPVAWFAVAQWPHGSEAAGAVNPIDAVLRLCEQIIDGGMCAHCKRMTMFNPDMPTDEITDVMLDAMSCVYAFDPELATYRRSCEGES